MKNILTILVIFISHGLHCQETFTLQPNGLFSTSQPQKDYVVIDLPGLSKSEIYNNTLVYLNTIYTAPKNVISTVENESISINAYAQSAVRRTNTHIFDMRYTISLQFKDEKMRVNAPTFSITSYGAGHQQQMHLIYSGFSLDGSHFGIYNNKGSLKNEKAKQDIETFFNNYLANLIQGLTSKSDW